MHALTETTLGDLLPGNEYTVKVYAITLGENRRKVLIGQTNIQTDETSVSRVPEGSL